ncbi:MAG: hypothetical protein B5M56_09945 [Desulfococcus sp. 4484_241]|nr:MAG: hypothetical protein B5M56_09945 [Desulfococcus sp. 4484_241]
MISITIETAHKKEMLDITSKLQKTVADSNVTDGVLVAYVPHTTAGITINENADPDVRHDILAHLEVLIPANSNFRHLEGNSDAHIQSSIMGSSVMVIIENGKLVLGTWQSVFFCEFDGPRTRKIYVQHLPA